jgi:hypothetical protein
MTVFEKKIKKIFDDHYEIYESTLHSKDVPDIIPKLTKLGLSENAARKLYHHWLLDDEFTPAYLKCHTFD